MPPHSDTIADCVLAAFHALPAKCKPRTLGDGRREWVALAGIVLSRDDASSSSTSATTKHASSITGIQAPSPSPASPSSSRLTCAALATGMKCLPQAKLEYAKGNVLHDWHAEVLAIRAFNRWLVDECAELARKGFGNDGAWVRWRREGREDEDADGHAPNGKGCAEGDGLHARLDHGVRGAESWQDQPFELHDDVRMDMYCSEAPCGDTSMELIMAGQEDATPWTQLPAGDEMLGRGNFDRLGVVRRKPARPDAPMTLSKSCSDKLAMKQCTSLLSGVTSLLVHPGRCYLGMVVLPESQCVPEAVGRAFGAEGRMKCMVDEGVQERWREAGYEFKPFKVKTTSREFEYSKRAAAAALGNTSAALVASNLSALYTPHKQEVLINGVLQGRRQFDPKGASCASRRRMWEAVADVAEAVHESTETFGSTDLARSTKKRSCVELKGSGQLEGRESVKRDVREMALKGWKRNLGDEDWGLDA